MNREQKMAWLIVITTTVAFLISCVAVIILAIKYGFPRAFVGFACMGLAGFGGLGGFFKKDKGSVALDERDRLIHLKAARAGFAVSYGVFGLVSMITWGIVGPGNYISVNALPNIWAAAFISSFFTRSVTLLVLYGREDKD